MLPTTDAIPERVLDLLRRSLRLGAASDEPLYEECQEFTALADVVTLDRLAEVRQRLANAGQTLGHLSPFAILTPSERAISVAGRSVAALDRIHDGVRFGHVSVLASQLDAVEAHLGAAESALAERDATEAAPQSTTELIERCLAASGLSVRAFADRVLAGRDESTVRAWRNGGTMPDRVRTWLLAWLSKHEQD